MTPPLARVFNVLCSNPARVRQHLVADGVCPSGLVRHDAHAVVKHPSHQLVADWQGRHADGHELGLSGGRQHRHLEHVDERLRKVALATHMDREDPLDRRA
eukprot:11773260-Prorocentrum_lima.AAC.1